MYIYAKPPFVFTKMSKIRCAIRINYCEYIRLATYFSFFLRNVTHEIMNIKHVCMKFAFQHAYWVENYSNLCCMRGILNTSHIWFKWYHNSYNLKFWMCKVYTSLIYRSILKTTASIGTCRYAMKICLKLELYDRLIPILFSLILPNKLSTDKCF